MGLIFDQMGKGLDAIYLFRKAREYYLDQERYEGTPGIGYSEAIRKILRRFYRKYGYKSEDFDTPGWIDKIF